MKTLGTLFRNFVLKTYNELSIGRRNLSYRGELGDPVMREKFKQTSKT